jgi:hypothetical protein
MRRDFIFDSILLYDTSWVTTVLIDSVPKLGANRILGAIKASIKWHLKFNLSLTLSIIFLDRL